MSVCPLSLECPENCVGGCHYSSVTKAAACNDNACADNFAVDSNSGLCTGKCCISRAHTQYIYILA